MDVSRRGQESFSQKPNDKAGAAVMVARTKVFHFSCAFFFQKWSFCEAANGDGKLIEKKSSNKWRRNY